LRNATQGVPYNDTGRTHNHVGDGAIDIPFVGRDVLDAPHLISAKMLNDKLRYDTLTGAVNLSALSEGS
jgi:hypothetical protein